MYINWRNMIRPKELMIDYTSLSQSYGKFIVDNNVPTIRVIDPALSRKLISEAMILYGDLISKFAFEKKIPVPYRVQEISKINSLGSQLDGNINSFKENIEMFNKSGEISYIKDALELYINTIKVINKQLREAKYKLQQIYKDKDTEVVYLIQKIYTLSDLLIIQPGTENKVISFSV